MVKFNFDLKCTNKVIVITVSSLFPITCTCKNQFIDTMLHIVHLLYSNVYFIIALSVSLSYNTMRIISIDKN